LSFRLIIPDHHEQPAKLKRILKKYKADHYYFLGDHMDSFAGLTHDTWMTIGFIRDHVQDGDKTFLWGNHDLHYAFPYPELICSGWDKSKLQMIRNTLSDPLHWKRFKLMQWLDLPTGQRFLMSHAGLHPYMLHPVHGFADHALADMEERAMYQLRYCQTVTALLKCGRGRGGKGTGGIVWLDWDSEFEPIPGLNQIVGHSPNAMVRQQNIEDTDPTKASINYCLDTHLNHVMLVHDDGHLEVQSVENV